MIPTGILKNFKKNAEKGLKEDSALSLTNCPIRTCLTEIVSDELDPGRDEKLGRFFAGDLRSTSITLILYR